MKQVTILPAGCQPWNTHVVAYGRNRWAYCSTLAIYVYAASPRSGQWTLEHIIAGHEKTITGISWSPADPMLLASSSLENRVVVWDIVTEKVLNETATQGCTPTTVAWSPCDRALIAYGTNKGNVVLWNRVAGNTNTIKMTNSPIRVLRWNPKKPGIFAVGNNEGLFMLASTSSRRTKRISYQRPDCSEPVTDIQWDPLSDNYCLIAYKDGMVREGMENKNTGTIVLFDTDAEKELNTFDKQIAGVRSLQWLRGTPGGFASSGVRTGIIRIWNVAHVAPIRLIRVKKCGFHNMVFLDQQRALCTFKDGSVGVFDVELKRWDFLSELGHTETIFDAEFKSDDPNILATGSFDGSIKCWDIRNMHCTQSMPGRDGVVYCVSWAPGGDTRLVAGTSSGHLTIWDTAKGLHIIRMHHHKDPVFRCSWSRLQPRLIASTCRDGEMLICRDDGKIVHRLRHPRSCYGVEWHPFNKDMLASGCHDGHVRIWDLSQKSPHTKTLKGHKYVGESMKHKNVCRARVFNVTWSPLIPDVLMSGSDDRTIRVWHAGKGVCLKTLKGHESNVRALIWSPELPNVALSGSWDGTIRVWDVFSGTQTHLILDHHADVYGLTVHPQRPFVFASSSRDTTLRLWHFVEPIRRMMLSALTKKSMSGLNHTGTIQWEQMEGNGTVLCGNASKTLAGSCRSAKSDVERFALMFDFFVPPEGTFDLWQLAVRDSSVVAVSSSLRPHERDVITIQESKASELESIRMSKFGAGVGSATREERMRAAAEIHLQLGRIEKYCDLMVELGEWDAAIAAAPGVSLEYWKSLCESRATQLTEKNDEAAVPLLLATRNIDKVLNLYISRNQLDVAFLIARVDQQGGFGLLPKGVLSQPDSLHDHSELNNVTGLMAWREYLDGKVTVAAACHLAAGQRKRAVQKLMKGYEVELAWGLVEALKIPGMDFVHVAMAQKLERAGLYEMASDLLGRTGAALGTKSWMCVRAIGNAKERERLHEVFGLPPPTSTLLSSNVDAALKRGDYEEAVRCMLLIGRYEKAIDLAVSEVIKYVSRPSWDVFTMVRVLWPLSNCPRGVIAQHSRRDMLLALCAYAGSLLATWKGYSIASDMVNHTLSLVKDRKIEGFPLCLNTLLLQKAHFLSCVDVVPARATVSTLLSQKDVPEHIAAAAQSWKTVLSKRSPDASSVLLKPGTADNAVVVIGSHLPAGTNRRAPLISMLSKKAIQGPHQVLEDGTSVISLRVAIMWSKCNPFSPLGSGSRIGPY